MMKQRMSAPVDNYNKELKLCILEMRDKRDTVIKQINQEEEEKRKLEMEIDKLTDRHSKLNEILSKRKAKKKDYDKTIDQTEAAYKKIIESSQTLLHVLKAEVQNLHSNEDDDSKY